MSPAAVKGLVAAILITLGLAGTAAGYWWYRRRYTRGQDYDAYTAGGWFQGFNWWGTGGRFMWADVAPWRWSAAARQRAYQQQVRCKALK
jgi:hypothetical protein